MEFSSELLDMYRFADKCLIYPSEDEDGGLYSFYEKNQFEAKHRLMNAIRNQIISYSDRTKNFVCAFSPYNEKAPDFPVYGIMDGNYVYLYYSVSGDIEIREKSGKPYDRNDRRETVPLNVFKGYLKRVDSICQKAREGLIDYLPISPEVAQDICDSEDYFYMPADEEEKRKLCNMGFDYM